MAKARKASRPVAHDYAFVAHLANDGSYFVLFPDLPGCMTGAERLEDLPAMIREVLELWIDGALEDGMVIPEPTYYDPELDYSGKFNLRVPKSLHRDLAEAAERDGVSLNQYVVSLLARRDAESALEQRVEALERAQPQRDTRIVADDRATYTAKRATKKRPTPGQARKRT